MLKTINILTLKNNLRIKIFNFKVRDHVRISKYKNIFAKRYTLNWSEEILVIKKVKIQSHGHMLLMI